ncbi:pilin [Legionella fallonii]|uniref:Tfp pilus assembly protein, major type IV pilin class A n=1 Tax=Legionella fallonii LLAP-10 TaxID=1212491 RepID=A0A098G6C6_9GAMM|nr:pilin [Legionella fallonii]CEG57519.1 Tfp pilus assembly protein, major type IV pilin class A [Legionella fallonii LLAP-10]
MYDRGFTLIEILITITIIGILIAIAIPAYQNYTIRVRVSDGLDLASGAQLAVNEYTMINNQLPATAADTQYTSPAATPNVSSIVMGNLGVITVNYTASAGNGSIILVPTLQVGGLTWDCTRGTLPAQYRPPSCR